MGFTRLDLLLPGLGLIRLGSKKSGFASLDILEQNY